MTSVVPAVTAPNAATLGYFVTDIPEIKLLGRSTWSSRRQQAIAALWETNRTVASRKAVLDGLLARTDPRHINYDETARQQLAAAAAKHAAAMARLAEVHALCLNAPDSDDSTCLIPQEATEALALNIPGPLRPPSAYWALAVRRGGPTNATIGDWTVVNDYELEDVQFSPAANAAGSGSARSFLDNFTTRLRSTEPNVARMQLGVAVGGEKISSIELVGLLDNSIAGKYPEAQRALSLHSWSGPSIEREQFGDLGFKSLGNGYGPNDTFLVLRSAFLEKEPCKPEIACILGGSKFSSYFRDYLEPNFTNVDNSADFETYVLVPVKTWISSGIKSGSGSLSFRIKDRFQDSTYDFDIAFLTWTEDPSGHSYSVRIKPNSPERYEEVMLRDIDIIPRPPF